MEPSGASLAASWKLPKGASEDGITLHDPGLSGSKEHWRAVEELGSGGFGIVWKEECVEGPPKGTARAVKSLVKNRMGFTKMSNRELLALITFSDPSNSMYQRHFVSCLGWFEDPVKLYIAMEFVPYGDLQDKKHVQRLCNVESEVAVIVTQLAQALQYMHQQGFVHRDLKPQNILVSSPGPNWHVKVADFGVCRTLNNSPMDTRPGTLVYMAPELLDIAEDGGSGDPYTAAIDVWALGAVTFFALTGAPPFPTLRQLTAYAYHNAPFPVENLGSGATWYCVNFLQALMDTEAARRPTIDRVLTLPWLAKSKPVSSVGRFDTTESIWNQTAAPWTHLSSPLAVNPSTPGTHTAAIPTPAEPQYSSPHPRNSIPQPPNGSLYLRNPSSHAISAVAPMRPSPKDVVAAEPSWDDRSGSGTLNGSASLEHTLTAPTSTGSSVRSQPLPRKGLFGQKYNSRSSFFEGAAAAASAPQAILTLPSTSKELKQKKSLRRIFGGLRNLVGRTAITEPERSDFQVPKPLPPPSAPPQPNRNRTPASVSATLSGYSHPGHSKVKSSQNNFNKVEPKQKYYKLRGIDPYKTCLTCEREFDTRDDMFIHLKYEAEYHAKDPRTGVPEHFHNGHWKRA